MNHKLIANTALISVFGSVLYGFALLSHMRESREISVYENRKLAQRPTLSLRGLVDRSLQRSYESFVSDQFVYREPWIRYWTYMQLALGKTLVHGYYIGPGNWILSDERKSFSASSIQRSADILNSFAHELSIRGKKVYLANVPAKAYALMPIKYPAFLRTQEPHRRVVYFLGHLDSESIKVIDISKDFLADLTPKEIEDSYLRTDNHWTAEASFFGYEMLVNHLIGQGYPLRRVNKRDYELRQLTISNFLGTFNRQLFRFVLEESTFRWYRYRLQDYHSYRLSVGLSNSEKPISWDDIYMNIEGKEWVTYGDLFSADYMLIKIINAKAAYDHHVLIVKDSYFNPLIVYMPEQFEKVTIVDPRYWPKGDARKFILNSDALTVIFFCHDLNTEKDFYEHLN